MLDGLGTTGSALVSKDAEIIPVGDVRVIALVGEGHFGQVYKGMVRLSARL